MVEEDKPKVIPDAAEIMGVHSLEAILKRVADARELGDKAANVTGTREDILEAASRQTGWRISREYGQIFLRE